MNRQIIDLFIIVYKISVSQPGLHVVVLRILLDKTCIFLNRAIAEGYVHLGFSSIICFSLDHICNDLVLFEFVAIPILLRPHKP